MGHGLDIFAGDKVVGQCITGVGAVGHGLGVDDFAIGQHFVGEHVDLFLRLFLFADHVAGIVMGKARLDTVAGVVGQ